MDSEKLIVEVQAGNADALDWLLHSFKPLVKAQAADFYLIGGDRDDLIQEGMIGLYKAVRDYDPQKPLPFNAFAKLCVNRQIMSAIKASARQKHQPLNQSVSLHQPVQIGEREGTYQDLLAEDHVNDPEALFINQEEWQDINQHLRRHLSELEYSVLTMHLQGRSHMDIALEIGKDLKSIDNTLQRVRRKMTKIQRSSHHNKDTKKGVRG